MPRLVNQYGSNFLNRITFLSGKKLSYSFLKQGSFYFLKSCFFAVHFAVPAGSWKIA